MLQFKPVLSNTSKVQNIDLSCYSETYEIVHDLTVKTYTDAK